MDRPLLIILLAMAGTLALFLAGIFPYPFGILVLGLMALGRVLMIRGGPD